MPPPSPPPHHLDVVIDFVNTLDTEEEVDELAELEGVQRWFAGHGLVGADAASPSPADQREAIALREALRTLMSTNNGEPADAAAFGVLNRASRRARLRLHFAPDGSTALEPEAGGFAGALARLLVPVAASVQDGTWSRVKACRDDNCQWAFYDRS